MICTQDSHRVCDLRRRFGDLKIGRFEDWKIRKIERLRDAVELEVRAPPGYLRCVSQLPRPSGRGGYGGFNVAPTHFGESSHFPAQYLL